jgi:hypothetical protein
MKKMFYKKNVKNITSKQIFARWQAILKHFSKIKYIKGELNSVLDFLTREFFTRNMNKLDRSKIQNPGNYAMNNPSFMTNGYKK